MFSAEEVKDMLMLGTDELVEVKGSVSVRGLVRDEHRVGGFVRLAPCLMLFELVCLASLTDTCCSVIAVKRHWALLGCMLVRAE
jgi:hypothetical protein